MNYLIIGDVIKDVYVKGSVLGVSAETPTLVMKRESTEEYTGGAALVQAHIQNLCNLEDWALQANLDPIMTKTRFFVDGYKLFQTDEIHDCSPINKTELKKALHAADVIIIADNRHGRIDFDIAGLVIDFCNRHDKPLFVDSQMSQSSSNHGWYIGARTMFLNEREAASLGCHYFESSLKRCSEKYHWKNIILKLGEDGSVAYVNGKYIKTPGIQVEALDTCGAGDAFMAALVSRDVINEEALQFANEYAASTCTYIGTGVPR